MKEQITSSISAALKPLRKQNDRFLFWSVYYPFNFGDWLGPYIYKKLANQDAWFKSPSSFELSTVFMGAGSILSLAKENCIVWGSGIISRSVEFPKPYQITAVRGPYSHERCTQLGIRCPETYGDPGLVLPLLYQPTVKKKYRLGVIPHFTDFHRITQLFSEDEVKVIDVRYPIEEIIDTMLECEMILSSSLHGLILSNAYDIPSAWASFDSKLGGDGIKFKDHYASIGEFNPVCLNNAHRMGVDDMCAYIQSTKNVYDTRTVAKRLLDVCPFPHRSTL